MKVHPLDSDDTLCALVESYVSANDKVTLQTVSEEIRRLDTDLKQKEEYPLWFGLVEDLLTIINRSLGDGSVSYWSENQFSVRGRLRDETIQEVSVLEPYARAVVYGEHLLNDNCG